MFKAGITGINPGKAQKTDRKFFEHEKRFAKKNKHTEKAEKEAVRASSFEPELKVH